MILLFHTNRPSFHRPNLPPILLYHPCSLYLPHPDSVSHMGYNRPHARPHGSQCTRIPGWIPLLVPVSDSSPGYSQVSRCAQGLRSDSYPPTLTYPCLRISETRIKYWLGRRPLCLKTKPIEGDDPKHSLYFWFRLLGRDETGGG